MSGVVTITFSRPESAAKALESLNGMKVDGRPMKVQHDQLHRVSATSDGF